MSGLVSPKYNNLPTSLLYLSGLSYEVLSNVANLCPGGKRLDTGLQFNNLVLVSISIIYLCGVISIPAFDLAISNPSSTSHILGL